MSRPPKWHEMLEMSRDEALNAVEFYNRPASRRSLEAFLVHMHIAWLYLLQAGFQKSGINYHYRDSKNPRRYQKIDGERRAWDLEQCTKMRWPDSKAPVRNNIELTIRLRNRVEHRYARGLMVAATGFCQSLVLNYEDEILETFGSEFSIAGLVHMPISLSTFTREGIASLIAAQERLPKKLKDFFIDYRAGLDESIANDRRFEFRIELVQKRAPKSEADLAVSFVPENELTEDELREFESAGKNRQIIIREKQRPVANLQNLKPKQACEAVEERIPYRFRIHPEFFRAWKQLQVRPAGSASGNARAKTDERYCVYDKAHDDYVYTPAYVDLLVARCGTAEGFEELMGRSPTLKDSEGSQTDRAAALSSI